MDVKDIIEWCSDELRTMHETPVRQTPEHIRRHDDRVLVLIAIRSKLEAAQVMADVLMGPNYAYSPIFDMYSLNKDGRKKQTDALDKWREA